MSSPTITPQIVDACDSHYQYVKARILAANPSRSFGGVVEARDWPMKEAVLEAFYLSSQQIIPLRSPHQSWSSILQSFKMQWVWMIQGDNIQQTQQSSNRGDKYRTNMRMAGELTNGLFPGFCQKKQFGVAADANNNPVTTEQGYSDYPRFVWWTQPVVANRIDRTSGIMYSSASVELSSYSPLVNS